MQQTAHIQRVDDIFPVVETASGRVRGMKSGGISVFKGVRYGADTSGANRYLPPQPVSKWAGVRDATAYGNFAPQLPTNRTRPYMDLILYDIQPGGMGEDCLVVNIWTPTTAKSSRRPVLVHLHGGGYYAGSGNSPQFDGEMLSRFGDVVVISVNHRIGSFGFLDLSASGERHAQSGAAGMLDLVAALRWVRENAEQFGGNPAQVMVFGQSGGGAKTSVLMAMPSASGLFHRAGIMSGSALRVTTQDASTKVTYDFMRHLGLGPDSTDELHKMSMHQLLAAQVALEGAERTAGEAPRIFSPVMDGVAIPRHPFDPDAPAVSSHVPLIVGTTLDERSYRQDNFELDSTGLLNFADALSGGGGEQLVDMYRSEDVTASNYLLQARMDTDATFRKSANQLLTNSVRTPRADVFSYLWKIPSPAYGGRYGATHGTDLGPSMHDVRNPLNGPSVLSLRLADQLAGAWVSFAATGKPDHDGIPHWPAYMAGQRDTMVFAHDGDHTCVQSDPRREFREYWAAR